ncbi:MAG: PorV/PorQ family protein, partial [bacterium]
GDVGTTSANFLKIPVDARAVGMGEAFTAISDDESAFDYNPAGMAQAPQSEISGTDIQWFQGINLGHLGGITPLGSLGTFGAGLTWLDDGSLVATKRIADTSDPLENYQVTGAFTPYDLSLDLDWAWSPAPLWNVGVGARLIQQVIDTYSGWGAALNLGVQRTGMWGWLDAGAAIQNLGTSIAVASAAAGQPLTFRAGLAGRFFERRLTLAADLAVPTDNGMVPSVGAEWWVFQPLALRVGYMGGYAGEPTAGLGFRYSIFLLDYAFQPFAALGDTNRVTITVNFGGPGAKVLVLRPLLGPQGEQAWREGGFALKPDKRQDVISWRLSVVGPDGVSDRVWMGMGQTPPTVAWDGRDQEGRVLPDGLYHARLDLGYPGDLKAHAESSAVELDSTPPNVSLIIAPLVTRPDGDGAVVIPAHLKLQASDKNGIGGWKLELRDKSGKLFKAFSGDGEPPDDLVWDGTDALGHTVESGSTYLFWPFAKDRLGNWGKGQPQALVVLLKEIHYDIASDALFEPGKADVRISAYKQLFALKTLILDQAAPGSKVDVVGHTDNTPVVHSVYLNNQELSLARAQAVCKFLVELLGMDPSMLNPVGMGDSQPKVSNATPEGRETNRRVEVVIHAKEYR